ncbi:hypothetical protein BWI17_07190 [Betaproteobacteria bacterium GR16-43]|nr:hypothetical protein BWI17_07190 [Betaproteobacteria bacterium GR16-43]
MTRLSLRRFLQALLAVSAVAAAGAAGAFIIPGSTPPPTSPVVEYFNADTNHFFYTIDAAEMAAIDRGAAGWGWSRTGFLFYAYPDIPQSANANFAACDQRSPPCVNVSRFIGTPGLGPNAHFFTANPAEVAILNVPGSGWTFESIAFAVPVPDPATGQCAVGTVPVYRAYSNRPNYLDSDHRYTTSEVVRARMRSEGWIEEGIAFCAYGAGAAPIVVRTVSLTNKCGIQSQAACDGHGSILFSCVGVTGIPLPATEYPGSSSTTDEFNARTGIFYMGNPQVNDNVALLDSSRAVAATGSFVQLSDVQTIFGIHMASPTGTPFASVTPMLGFPVTAPRANAPDFRLFPFRKQLDTEYEIAINFTAGVNRIAIDAGSHAFGLLAIDFVDTRSGGHFRSHVLAYGTPPEGEFTGRDTDGVIIVATSFRAQSPYGRNVNGVTVHMPANYQPLAPYLAPYQWRVNRAEFLAMVASARGLDPALSTDPADYAVGSFGVRTQMSGPGEIGLFVYGINLSLFPL